MIKLSLRIWPVVAALMLCSCKSSVAGDSAGAEKAAAGTVAAPALVVADSDDKSNKSDKSDESDRADFADFGSFARSLADLPADRRRAAIDTYMDTCSADSIAYRQAAVGAEETFFETSSELADEDVYRMFVDRLLADNVLSADEKIRFEYHRNVLDTTPVGSPAPDFTMLTRSGNDFSLRELTGAERTLLVFYDSDCNSCMSTLEKMMMNRRLAKLTEARSLYVAVIDIAGDREIWQSKANLFPSDWLVGYDDGLIESEELYSIRNAPSLYLLDSEGTILVKDSTWKKVLPLLQ